MHSHLIQSPSELEEMGFVPVEYQSEMLYGEYGDRISQAGAYSDPLTRRLLAIRMFVGPGKMLFNTDFLQTVSSEEVLFNLPDWKMRPGTEKLSVCEGDLIDVFVAFSGAGSWPQNFAAGKMRVSEVISGRPNKIRLLVAL